jgi:hypothetical protein
MNMSLGSIALALVCLAPARSLAADGAPGTELSPDDGYCQWLEGAAAAASAPLTMPDLFAAVGAVDAGSATGGSAIGTPGLKLQAGLGYSFSDLLKGRGLRRQALAECRRHRSGEALRTALRSGADVGEAQALAARAAVLEEVIPKGVALVAALREDVRAQRVTLEELNAAELRLDGLRALAGQTRLARERILARTQAVGGQDLAGSLRAYRDADREVERIAGGLRRTSAWDLRLHGGLEQVVGPGPAQFPLFALATLTYNLGALRQDKANALAAAGRLAWSGSDLAGGRGMDELLAEARAIQATEKSRLAEVEVLKRDLEQQLAVVQAVESAQVRRYRDFVWFELARVRAEHAYLDAHVRELGAFAAAGEAR